MPDELDAVHPWHVDVADDDVGRLRTGERVQRVGAVTRLGERADAEPAQQRERRPALEVVIVDDEHRERGELGDRG